MKYGAISLLLTYLMGCTTLENPGKSNSEPAKNSVFLSELKPRAKGYAPVNGIKMYYEIYGPDGDIPLVLIHGGGSTLDSAFSKFLPFISASRQVIAIEEQGHGRTEGRPGPVSFSQTAEDVAELLKHLKIQQADLFGFSNGASSSMQVAIRHPSLVRKLIFASSFTKRSGAVEGFWKNFEGVKKCSLPHGLEEAFLKVNPRKDLLIEMCDKDLARIKNFIETPDKDVRKVNAPTLVLMGDKDIVTLKHGQELAELIPNARLAVLPGNHGSYFGDVAAGTSDPGIIEGTSKIVEAFLNSK